MKNSQVTLLRDEPVKSALFKLALPSILTSLVMTLYNLVDTVYVSQLQNNNMIAATTVALPIMIIVQAFGDGLGAGSGSFLGRSLGAKDHDKIDKTIATTVTLTIIISVVALIGAFTFLKDLIALFSDDPIVLAYTFDYIQILMFGTLFAITKQVSSYVLRSIGDVRFPMIAIVTGVTINAILDPIFMFEWGFNMGIKGVALATIISQCISASLLFGRLWKHNVVTKRHFTHLSFDPSCAKEIFNVGFAVFIRNGLPSFSYGFFAKSAGLFGTDFIAAAGIARKTIHFATFVVFGIAQGYQPFAAYNYGARNYRRLWEAIKVASIFTIIYGFFMAGLYMFVPHLVLRVITPDKNLIDLALVVMRGYAISMPVLGVYQILAGTFQSTGKGRLSFFTSVFRQGIVYVPLMILLPQFFGKVGFASVQPITDILSVIVVGFLGYDLIKELRFKQQVEE